MQDRKCQKYLTVIERADDGTYSAYVPDLPGCVAVGQVTPEAASHLIEEVAEAHIAGLREDGAPIPEPSARAEYVDAPAA